MAMQDLGRAEAWGEGSPGPVPWVPQMALWCHDRDWTSGAVYKFIRSPIKVLRPRLDCL